ncbi:MAG: (5-formylfuran-3-yl)methyl phosphate synthase [Burkholderiaceae bacterium]
MSKNLGRVPILVSVRSPEEAYLASKSGADFVDAKEPSAGALGKLPISKIKEIISTLRFVNFSGKVTATYGDNIEKIVDFNSHNFFSYFFLGLNAIKIGFDARGLTSSEKVVLKLVDSYNEIIFNNKNKEIETEPSQLIPVLMVDKGLNIDFVEFLMSTSISNNIFGIMIDTKNKMNSNLFDIIDLNTLNKLFKKIDSFNLPYGIAGSLNKSNSEVIKQLQPSWAGYRGGVCSGDRKGDLSEKKIRLIIKSLEVT